MPYLLQLLDIILGRQNFVYTFHLKPEHKLKSWLIMESSSFYSWDLCVPSPVDKPWEHFDIIRVLGHDNLIRFHLTIRQCLSPTESVPPRPALLEIVFNSEPSRQFRRNIKHL